MDRHTEMHVRPRLKQLALLLAAITLLLCACAVTPDRPGAVPGETAVSTASPVSETDAGKPLPVPSSEASTEKTEEGKPLPVPSSEASTEKTEELRMKLRINDIETDVLWEDNESVAALRSLAAEAPLTIQLSPYGGFEQVGPIGQSLPRQDTQTVTEPGDVVLYSGNQIVVFYGSNSWAYTRLGKIRGMDRAALTELLGNGAVTLTLSVGAVTAEP